ncbi:hypothetical protein Stsp02_14060 [Streptomyces sp. NBRC 14336]|uniref:VMAP-C domain-containing protein n=1 Tax=Streptomyces sp. NBRC 14336 TaxID=3030992 RepID=UPI0024A11AE2|nr:hypothetical protein [Streptomyces sp. NBRC 14336]GLW45744.1 hypothetical protein Stsp02_14060 [Streptomyces sp. NBRC 14336]
MTGRELDAVELELIARIVEVLEEPSGGLMDDAARRFWRDRMNRQVEGLPQDTYPSPRLVFLSVVTACAERDRGLEPLIDVTQFVAPALERLLRPLIDEWRAYQVYRGHDWVPLRKALQQSTDPTDLAELFAAASQGRRRLPEHCRTPWEAFLNLADLNTPPDGPPPSIAFLHRLARSPDLDPAAADALRTWNAQLPDEWQLPALPPAQETTALPAPESLEKPSPDEPRPPIRVYISIAPDHAPQRRRTPRYRVAAAVKFADSPALQREPETESQEPVTRDRLRTRVAELLSRVAAACHDRSDPIALEFFLPVELLDEPVEWWDRDPARGFANPLLYAYRVTLHSLERVQRPEFHRAWRERHARWTRQQMNNGGSPHGPGRVHVCPQDPAVTGAQHLSRLDAVVGRDEDVVAMVMCEVPWKKDTLGGQEVNLALEHGVFVWIYHRAEGSPPEWRSALEDAMGEVGLAGLPEHAHQWKTDTDTDRPGAHDPAVVRSLVVLWDDPEQLLDGGPAAPAAFVGGIS